MKAVIAKVRKKALSMVATGEAIQIKPLAKEISRALIPALAKLYQEQGQKELSAVRARAEGKGAAHTVSAKEDLRVARDFDVLNPMVQEVIENQAIKLAESTTSTIEGDLDTALAEVRDRLAQGIVEKGAAIPELTKAVNGVFEKALTWQAERIARTETMRAFGDAGILAAEQ